VAEARPGRFRDRAVHLADGQGHVVYEPPPAAEVAALTGEMCEWLRSEEAAATPPVVRAAMAHLHVAVIHPWLDGNGRMARVVHSLVLACEGELAAPFASIEGLLGRHTQSYFAALAAASPGGRYDPAVGDATPWVGFAVRAHLLQALEHQRNLAEAGSRFRLCMRMAVDAGLPERAASALDQALLGLPSRNDSYRAEHGVSRPTATRDLVALERAGLLQARGAGRAVAYVAPDTLVRAWAEARGAPAPTAIDRRIQELAAGLGL
jgi:Fic family protein